MDESSPEHGPSVAAFSYADLVTAGGYIVKIFELRRSLVPVVAAIRGLSGVKITRVPSTVVVPATSVPPWETEIVSEPSTTSKVNSTLVR